MNKKELRELYYNIKLPRYIENRMLLLLRQGKISKWFSGIGQEAISVGATYALNKDDVILPMHRNLGVFTTREVNLKKLFCQLFGKKNSFTKGRDRTFHFGDMNYNIVGMISHLAAMLPVATGFGLSYKLKNNKKIALSFIGDGATSEGDFHESLNLASVWGLPVIFLIENNGYGLSTPTKEQYNCKQLVDRAIGYGIEGISIDGNDVVEVYNVIKKYTKMLRNNPRPILIEANTFRIRGHEEASGVKYVPKSIIEKWKKNETILKFEKYLNKNKIITEHEIKKIDNEIEKKVLPAIDYSLNESNPDSTEETEIKEVFQIVDEKIEKYDYSKVNNIRFVDSIRESMMQKMNKDNKVLIMGQDIAEYGGVFKVTEGFLNKFGSDRVKNTPITESAVIGAAMGLAIEGYKPIVEMQFADFISDGFNQVVNNLSTTYYRWGQAINVTLRLPTGGSIGAGPFHSQCNEAWFFHVPGLKIVYPSNPFDAKGLLASSIDDPNPVLFFEHKALYRSLKSDVPCDLYKIKIGESIIVEEGSDLSIITYGLGVQWALDCAKKSKYSIEILDLRTLNPLDKESIYSTVRKTNRVLILHEDNLTGGIGGEISSMISEHCFDFLDAPIARLGSMDTPVPFSDNLEKIYLPKNKIKNKIEKLMSF